MLPFLVIKGSRVLEKKVNDPQVSKDVFSHLNPAELPKKTRTWVTLKVLMYEESGGLVKDLLSVFSATSLYMV